MSRKCSLSDQRTPGRYPFTAGFTARRIGVTALKEHWLWVWTIDDQVAERLSVMRGFEVDIGRAAHERNELHESITQQVMAVMAMYCAIAESNGAELSKNPVDVFWQIKWIFRSEDEATGMHFKVVGWLSERVALQ